MMREKETDLKENIDTAATIVLFTAILLIMIYVR